MTNTTFDYKEKETRIKDFILNLKVSKIKKTDKEDKIFFKNTCCNLTVNKEEGYIALLQGPGIKLSIYMDFKTLNSEMRINYGSERNKFVFISFGELKEKNPKLFDYLWDTLWDLSHYGEGQKYYFNI